MIIYWNEINSTIKTYTIKLQSDYTVSNNWYVSGGLYQ